MELAEKVALAQSGRGNMNNTLETVHYDLVM